MPKTKIRGHTAMTRKSPGCQTPKDRRGSPTSADGEHDIRNPHPQEERKPALRDVYALEPVAPKFNPWSSCPITFDRRDHPTSIRHGGFAVLVLDPIIDGFHLTRVLMDGGNSLNLLYQDTVRKMGIDPSRFKPTKTTFKGVIPGVEASCTGSVTLEVVFGSPDNLRSEELIFDIVPFRSGYHALLG